MTTPTPESELVARHLRSIADASRREDGTDIPLGEQCRAGADLIERQAEELAKLREASKALYHACDYEPYRSTRMKTALAAYRTLTGEAEHAKP